MLSDGLFDLQVNGYAGVDFNDPGIRPGDLDIALEAMLSHGVTGCLPTIITARREELRDRFRALDAAVEGSRLGRRMVAGYHLEGPFLNEFPGYAGCHPAAAMGDPDIALLTDLEVDLGRPIVLVTLAPERQGADRLHRGDDEARQGHGDRPFGRRFRDRSPCGRRRHQPLHPSRKRASARTRQAREHAPGTARRAAARCLPDRRRPSHVAPGARAPSSR